MAKTAPTPKLRLSPSRDIPFNKLVLSQKNVRRTKAGVSIEALAEDIDRRTLLQGLNVRPVFDGEGTETGMFEVPAGGRRYRALELLVSRKRLAGDAAVPCVVRIAGGDGDPTAEEDSLAENTHREQLHPLDQFWAMQTLVEQGSDIDAIAARFMTTPAVVRQRLRLASVSPKLQEIYAEDGMTLEQLMAFSVELGEGPHHVDEIFDLAFHRRPHILVTVRKLNRRPGMNLDRLGEIELDRVAIWPKGILDQRRDQRMLDEGCGMAGSLQQAAEPLGAGAVEIPLAKGSRLEDRIEVRSERRDLLLWDHAGEEAPALLAERVGRGLETVGFRQSGVLCHTVTRAPAARPTGNWGASGDQMPVP
jgi:hypothetical protein